MIGMAEEKLTGEYGERGAYHKHLDPQWSYYPIYVRKVKYIDEFLAHSASDAAILDAGCGEGVLVEKYHAAGRNITGLDLNVENGLVRQGDILNMPFEDACFDIVLFLDVLEHLGVQQHPAALQELSRVLKHDGTLVMSVPNLAHKASRWNFFKTGALLRTASAAKHPGDRPVTEYMNIIAEAGLLIEKRIPVKLTLPPLQQKLLKWALGSSRFEAYVYSPERNPDDCFLNIFFLRKHARE